MKSRSVLLVFADEAINQRDEFFAGSGKDEGGGGGVPIEFETCGESGDPYLANRRIGRDDEFAGRLFENDVQNTILFLDLEAGLVFFFADNEMFFQRFQSALSRTAKLHFVLHGIQCINAAGLVSQFRKWTCAQAVCA